MSLKIEVKSSLVQDISGVSKVGKPYHIRKQVAWASTYDQSGVLNPYPERIELSLNDDQPPYAVGYYLLSDKCLYVGDFNSLAVGRLLLDPLVAKPTSAA